MATTTDELIIKIKVAHEQAKKAMGQIRQQFKQTTTTIDNVTKTTKKNVTDTDRLAKSWENYQRKIARGEKAYNRLSDVQKKAVGSQTEFARAVEQGGESLKEMQTKLHGVKKPLQDADTHTKRFQQRLHKLRADMMDYAIVLGIVTIATKAAWDFTFAGAQINEQMDALDRLAARHGTTSEAMIANLRRVSKETIANAQIVRATGKAMVMGIAPDTLTTLMEVATAAARTMGKTTDEMFADITLGTARMSKKILDNIGIIVDWETAYTKHAAAIGVTVSMLDEEEKMVARTNAIKEKGTDIIAVLNTETLTQRERLDKLVTSWQNVGNAAKQAFVDMVMPPEGIAANKNRIELIKEEIAWIKKRHAQFGLPVRGGTRFEQLKQELQVLQAFVNTDRDRIIRQEALKKISAGLNRNLTEFQNLQKDLIKENAAEKLNRQYDTLLATFGELVRNIRAKGATAPDAMVQGWIEARNKIKGILPKIAAEIEKALLKEAGIIKLRDMYVQMYNDQVDLAKKTSAQIEILMLQFEERKLRAATETQIQIEALYGDFEERRMKEDLKNTKRWLAGREKMQQEFLFFGLKGEELKQAQLKKFFDEEMQRLETLGLAEQKVEGRNLTMREALIKEHAKRKKAIEKDYTEFSVGQLQQQLANENLAGEERLRIRSEVQERIKEGNIGAWESFKEGSTAAAEQYGNDQQMMMDMGMKTTNILTDNMGNMFFSISSGAKSAKEAMKDFALSFAKDIQRMISQMLAMYVVQQLVGLAFVGAAAGAGGGEGAAAGAGATGGGAGAGAGATGGGAGAGAGGGTMLAAKGAVFPGHFTPLPMQGGHLATRPTLGLIAETPRARPEIVSPEPLMRKIVQEESGGRGGDTNIFNINTLDPIAWADFVERNPGPLINAVSQDIRYRGKLHGDIKTFTR